MGSFGGEAIDAHGVTRDFPAQSMLTGLLANALGWTRRMREEHQRLQDRVVFGAVHDADPSSRRATDYQTAQLAKADRVWSVRGAPIGRAGGAATYKSTHQRWRDYHADLRISVVLRLDPAQAPPALRDLADALERPARPLFVGRKPFLPTAPVFRGWIDADNVRDALAEVVATGTVREAIWPRNAGAHGATATQSVTDERNWTTGLHGGARLVCRGPVTGTRGNR